MSSSTPKNTVPSVGASVAGRKPSAPATDICFDGSNWEDLTRLCTLSKLHRYSGTEVDSDLTQTTWVARHFVGPALDWLTSRIPIDKNLFADFNSFTEKVREQFGITDTLLLDHQKVQLESLQWRRDLPTFFAEFDRLTLQCGMGANDITKITLLLAKMPVNLRTQLALQAFSPTSYTEYRSGLLTRWALNPQGASVSNDRASAKPKCGKCKKKGHTAAECRSPAQASGN